VGEWSDVGYLRSGDLAQVWKAVDALCAAKGYVQVAKPPPRPQVNRDPMQYGPGTASPLWAVGLVPGDGEWTALMAAPLRLFGERAPGTGRARLVDLAEHAGCDAFLFCLSDGSAWLLAEATPRGDLALSGWPYEDYEDDEEDEDDAGWTWVEELLGPDSIDADFQLLEVSEPLRVAVRSGAAAFDEIPAAVGAHEYYSAFWLNGLQADALLPHQEPDLSGVEIRYYRATT
jgi:hypothetical protein